MSSSIIDSSGCKYELQVFGYIYIFHSDQVIYNNPSLLCTGILCYVLLLRVAKYWGVAKDL